MRRKTAYNGRSFIVEKIHKISNKKIHSAITISFFKLIPATFLYM